MSLVTLTENSDWNPLETTLFGGFSQLFYKNCHIKNHASKKLILPATKLTRDCYCEMFKGCTNLNYVKCLATEISSAYCTDEWLEDVSTSGTFVKAKNMTSWESGVSGIPSGWTIKDAE